MFYRCHFIHSSQEALTHNKNVAAYQARLQQSRMKSLSMSTSSDRETSSVGSLSPTMTNVQNQSTNCFGDHQMPSSPTNIFSYSFSPSNSPILNEMSASISPPPQQQQQQQPPQISGSGLFVKPTFIDQTAVHVMKQIPEDRLPVFNQISSAIDSMSTFKI